MGERQQEQELEIIQHFSHEHPLRRIPNITEETSQDYFCYGCWRDFFPGDVGYGCSINCGVCTSLHEECAKMGREIRHRVHPSHPLTQKIRQNIKFVRNARCSVCDFPWDELGKLIYICSQGCELFIHLGCVSGLLPADDQVMNHPSHPQHQLKFIDIMSCHFKCNACGTSENGCSYICKTCKYWIHESCATLPTPTLFHHHHHHLSLSFILPVEYVRYNYACGICGRSLQLTNWVYHCEICRYVVHIKCATNAATSNSIENEYAVDEEHRQILKVPVNDIYEELIRPFIERERGEILNPQQDNEIFSSYKFSNHHHPLSFILFSSLPYSHDNINEEDEDDADDNKGESSTLTCDGCTEPIHQKKHNPSTSSSSYSYENGYMSCGKCKYFLHLACFNLPQQLTSSPFHQIKDHHLELQTIELMHNWALCDICYFETNGLFYACTKCRFQIDIKCISLPNTIKHAAHLHSDLKRVVIGERGYMYCHVGQHHSYGGLVYRCDRCKSCVCVECVMLPARTKHRLENHMLPLTFNASVNHPDEFYCASCEVKMNPKSWMYHCQRCDQSFHPNCIPATSGLLRNFNFGKKLYHVSRHPQHPLRLQAIFKKKWCHLCHRYAYNDLGYQCTSCNFIMCQWHEDDVKLIDS